MESTSYTPNYVIPGDFTPQTMPDPANNKGMFAWDDAYKCYMQCDGVEWKPTSITANVTSYTGVTNAQGEWTVTFATPKLVVPHVNPQLYPTTDASITCRLIAVSINGFTVKVEQRSSLTVLTMSVLSFAVTNVNGANIRALVVD